MATSDPVPWHKVIYLLYISSSSSTCPGNATIEKSIDVLCVSDKLCSISEVRLFIYHSSLPKKKEEKKRGDEIISSTPMSLNFFFFFFFYRAVDFHPRHNLYSSDFEMFA